MGTVRIRFACRRRTAAQWTSLNEVLLVGEWGVETDLLPAGVKAKIGDGVTAWNSLGYAVDTTASGGGSFATITGDPDDNVALAAALDAHRDAAIAAAATDATTKANAAQAAAIAASDPLGAAAAAQAAAATDATTKANAAQAFAIQRANHTGSQAQSTVTNLVADLALKADLVGGLVPSAQIPAIAITEYLGSVASQVAMLALVGQKGDWALRSDLGTTWIITGNDPTQLADWTQLSYPTAPVTSVNGQTGAVTLAKGDVGLGNADNTSDASKPVSTAQAAADAAVLAASQPIDQTLTALAAANWAANAIPIGTGADTLSQTAFAANTFPARGSTGNLAAKTISDDALTFNAAANFAAMRTALGATTVGGNLFTLANPGAVRFLRVNADNTITARTAAELASDIGAPSLSADQTWTGQNTFGIGTITTSKPHTISQTWNAAGVTFEALVIDITSTASAAGSLGFNIKVGGASVASITKAGALTIAAGLTMTAGQVLSTGQGRLGNIGGNEGLIVRSGGRVCWSSAVSETGTQDTVLTRAAAGIMALAGNGTGGALQLLEMTAPVAGAANTGRLFLQDNGAGKSQLMVIFASGAAQQIAIEP